MAQHGGALLYHEVSPRNQRNGRLHFHGIAVASILAGKRLGVAPGATLHYFAVPMDAPYTRYYITAIQQTVELNATLPPEERIRLIVISDSPDPQDVAVFSRWEEVLAEAKQAAIVVIYSGPDLDNITLGGTPPGADRDDPESYRLSAWLERPAADQILVPTDFITTANTTGASDYIYWGEGGFSWAIPYIGGLLTLAWQIDPHLPFQEFMVRLEETASRNSNAILVVNPPALLESVGEQRGSYWNGE